MFPAFTLVVLKTTKPAGWEVHVGRTAVPYSPHHLFLIPRFLISSKWSLFFPPLDHVTVVTSCNSIELKLKRNHIYSFFTQLEILLFFWWINSIWLFMQWKGSMQVCTWYNWCFLDIPLCTLLRILFVNMPMRVHQYE